MARAFVGTSGWAYPTWRPKFYPEGTKPGDFLRHYGTRLGTNEVNYTFNHLPTEKNVADWTKATSPDFLFALKASQRITHVDRLAHPADTLPLFMERARLLGERLGPILFQTPPWLKRDDDLLANFVGSLPSAQRFALEVRDPSWYVPETEELLRLRKVTLVHAEGERAPSPVESLGRSADFAYVRLRDERGYDEAAVAAWAERLRALLAAGKDVYAYFRHDEDGANGLAAERLRDLLA
ncbi:MAG: DUF72 domain-containing protein [Candidatus Limnocylindria bacterium]